MADQLKHKSIYHRLANALDDFAHEHARFDFDLSSSEDVEKVLRERFSGLSFNTLSIMLNVVETITEET